MRLYEALGLALNGNGIMISLVGGGGKTSTILTLANELAKEEEKVLITTTTAMYKPKGVDNPNIYVLGDHLTPEGKLKGITLVKADAIYREGSFDYILVEADGSRGKPIKAPAEHEPVIPFSTGVVIGVIGMDALGEMISSSFVHRPEILAELTDANVDSTVDEELIVKLVSDAMGLFKNSPPDSRKILLLNKAIGTSLEEAALRIGSRVIALCNYVDRVIIGTVLEENPVKKLLLRKI